MREQTLDRLIRLGLKSLAVGIAAVAVIYFIETRDKTPTLVSRQIAAAEDAVRKAPEQTGLRLRLADMYRAAKRPDDALEQYDAVLKIEPKQGTALLGRGEVLAEREELKEAKKSFGKIVGSMKGKQFAPVDPQLEAAYYGMASVLLKEGKAKSAAVAARDATKIEPADADAWYLVGTADVKARRYKQGITALKKAVLFVPTEWCEPYEQLSKAYEAQRRKPQADYAGAMVELCEKDPAGATQRLEPLTKGPVAVEAMVGLGMAAELQNQRESAKRWYRMAVAREPENFNARTGLARLGAPVLGGK
ncbi:MAG TPA: tetratricopeptide repeat protein [Solirubrobacterales bacterium]|nr:tetratricopeptide repeat protein [Solirubrobacterales bacterium]